MKYFTLDEFKCKCCGVQHMDALFLAQLDRARGMAEVPFEILSGYRCSKHNQEEGSTSQNHPSGKASDIKATDGPTRGKIIMGLYFAGFRRIGIDFAQGFVHVDSMDDIESLWPY
jgi:uncharacterized protein YcbK (DUF882 family)